MKHAKFNSIAKSIWGNSRLLFVVSVVLLAISTASLLAALNIQHQDELRHRVSSSQTPFKGGQEISMGSAIVSASFLKYADGTEVFSAPDGEHYAIVTLTVKNKSDVPIMVMPSTDTYMKDASGKVTYLTPFGLDNPFHAGELLPGEQVTGELSYLLPKGVANKFYVDSDWSGGVLPFALN